MAPSLIFHWFAANWFAVAWCIIAVYLTNAVWIIAHFPRFGAKQRKNVASHNLLSVFNRFVWFESFDSKLDFLGWYWDRGGGFHLVLTALLFVLAVVAMSVPLVSMVLG